jgi:hypothetical protein
LNKYSYVPSYIYSYGSKYRQLTDEYDHVFKRYISTGEKTDLFVAVTHISRYIAGGFFFAVKNNYDSKNAQEKIISAMYGRLKSLYGGGNNFDDEIKEKIYEIAENSVYYALGIDEYKNRKSYLWSKESAYENFLKHVNSVVFVSLVHDHLKSILEAFTEEYNLSTEYEDTESAEDILENSNISWGISPEIKTMILDYLRDGDLDNINIIQSYLQMIYKSREQ